MIISFQLIVNKHLRYKLLSYNLLSYYLRFLFLRIGQNPWKPLIFVTQKFPGKHTKLPELYGWKFHPYSSGSYYVHIKSSSHHSCLQYNMVTTVMTSSTLGMFNETCSNHSGLRVCFNTLLRYIISMPTFTSIYGLLRPAQVKFDWSKSSLW